MALKKVKYESATSICQICNSQIGVGNVYEWGNKEGNNYRMIHPACKNYPPPSKCNCQLYSPSHGTDHCKNNAVIKIELKDDKQRRSLCYDCVTAYKDFPLAFDVIEDRGEKKDDMKIKCTHCSEQALYTNNEGLWVCEKHQDYKGKGKGEVDIHEIVKEFRKYINLDDLDTIAQAKEKLKSINLDEIVEDISYQKTVIEGQKAHFENEIADIEKIIAEQRKKLIPTVIKIEIDGQERLIVGKHKSFPELIQLVANKVDCFLNGPAGSGKNTAVEQAAKELNAKFHFLQLSQLSLKSELTGYRNITSDKYIGTTFSEAYEHGGIFFADEFDNWAPSVVTSVNMALANGMYEFPHGTVKRHKDFVFVAAGNTIGLGAENHYVTSRALSGASRDRLVFLEWPIDEVLEFQMVEDKHKDYVKFVQKCRAIVETNGSQMLITPRATIQGAKMFDIGWSKEQVIRFVVLRGQQVPSYLKSTIEEFVK